MRRRIFSTLSALSLLLCLATVALWCVDYGNTPPNLRSRGILGMFGWSVAVGAGGFSVDHYRKLPQPITVAGADGIIDPGLYGRACGEPWERLGVRHRPFAGWENNPKTKTPGMVVGVLDMWSVKYSWATEVTAVFPMLWLVALGWRYFRGRLHVPGTCWKCGYDLRASKERCPECGTAIPADSGASGEPKAV